MDRLKFLFKKNKDNKENTNTNTNNNNNNMEDIYNDLNNMNLDSIPKVKYELNMQEQKMILDNYKFINHNVWISKMENEFKINDNDYKIMSKILLNEACRLNKNKIMQNIDNYIYLLENNSPIKIRNYLNGCLLFEPKYNKNVE